MLIRELSRKTGASVRSLRYYESKKLIASNRLENGYRIYDDAAINQVKTIQLYISLGLNTDDIAHIIHCPTTVQNHSLCKAAYDLYKIKLEEVNKQLAILQEIQSRLQERINEWENLNRHLL